MAVKGRSMTYSKFSRAVRLVALFVASASGLLALSERHGLSAWAADAKVAAVFGGPVTDKGFSQSVYEAIKGEAEKSGFGFAYTNSLTPAAEVEALRGYARSGATLIVGVGEEFSPPSLEVGKQYPNVHFAVVNANKSNGSNVASVIIDQWPLGYLAGVVAAKESKTKTLGIINGIKLASTTRIAEGFEAGAKAVDPAIKILSAFTGDFSDPAKGKAAATAMISSNADVIVSALDLGAQGIVAAAKQAKDVHTIGFFVDQGAALHEPELFYTSAIANWPEAAKEIVRLEKAGKFEGKAYTFAVENPNFAYLAPFGPAVSQGTKDAVEQALADFRAGKIRAP